MVSGILMKDSLKIMESGIRVKILQIKIIIGNGIQESNLRTQIKIENMIKVNIAMTLMIIKSAILLKSSQMVMVFGMRENNLQISKMENGIRVKILQIKIIMVFGIKENHLLMLKMVFGMKVNHLLILKMGFGMPKKILQI